MALKPNAQTCAIKEQILEDPVTGLTLQFELRDDGTTKLRIYGRDLPFGNREIIFDAEGKEEGAGVFTGELCRPSWLRKVG
jgi:hypothetical protein